MWGSALESTLQATTTFHSFPCTLLPQGVRQVFAETPEGTTFSAKSFSDLHLSRPLIRACQALGYQHPTPIQVGIWTTLPWLDTFYSLWSTLQTGLQP